MIMFNLFYTNNAICIKIFSDNNCNHAYLKANSIILRNEVIFHSNVKKIHLFIDNKINVSVRRIVDCIINELSGVERKVKIIIHHFYKFKSHKKYIEDAYKDNPDIILDTSNVSYFSFHDYCYRVSFGNVSGISIDKITIETTCERMMYEKQNNG